MPLSENYSARVPLVTGLKMIKILRIISIVNYNLEDDFLKKKL